MHFCYLAFKCFSFSGIEGGLQADTARALRRSASRLERQCKFTSPKRASLDLSVLRDDSLEPAHFRPSITIIVETPCASTLPLRSRTRASEEMTWRLRAATRASARTRPVSWLIRLAKFALVSIVA
jgi:hypothetical protein